MGFREDLDLSDFIGAYEEYLHGGGPTVAVVEDPEQADTPMKIGFGPSGASTRTDLAIKPEICWDVLGYYRTLGVHWRASKRELMQAYQALGTEPSAWATHCFKQLLVPEIRAAYDAAPLGELFLEDEWVQQNLKNAAKIEAGRRTAAGTPVSYDKILDERGYNFIPETPRETSLETVDEKGKDAKVSPPRHTVSAWTWAYFLWRCRRSDSRVLGQWQALLINQIAQRGVRTRIAVGFMGKNPRPFAIAEVDNVTVVFLSDKEEPSEDLAERAAEQLLTAAPSTQPELSQ